MLALINDRRLQRGQPPLGFLNPALYRLRERGHGGALFDVSGAGSGCSAAVRGEAGKGPGGGVGSLHPGVHGEGGRARGAPRPGGVPTPSPSRR